MLIYKNENLNKEKMGDFNIYISNLSDGDILHEYITENGIVYSNLNEEELYKQYNVVVIVNVKYYEDGQIDFSGKERKI